MGYLRPWSGLSGTLFSVSGLCRLTRDPDVPEADKRYGRFVICGDPTPDQSATKIRVCAEQAAGFVYGAHRAEAINRRVKRRSPAICLGRLNFRLGF